MLYRWVKVRSDGNKKLGMIPAVYAEQSSCPESCSLKGAGCYAESHMWIAKFWREVSQSLNEICLEIAALAEGQLWRYGVAGDLPGRGERIHARALRLLVTANRGRKGFAFTHKPPSLKNQRLIHVANQNGFTINWSAESLGEADVLASLNVAPITCIVHPMTPAKGTKTPGGRPVVVCPAQWKEDVTCASCGACAVSGRRTVIGFWPHGSGKKKVMRRLFEHEGAPRPASRRRADAD